MRSKDILADLIGFSTISRDSNLALINYIESYLKERGIQSSLIFDEHKSKANLYATIGPKSIQGLMLSGHTDVVPVEGQAWTKPPFKMTEDSRRLYGRGACDMKGFIACALALVDRLDESSLKIPIHFAFSYDEELGCLGVRSLIDMLEKAPIKPKFCLVGEPTNMQMVLAHKGKVDATANIKGRAAHSSLAPTGLNAIYLGSELIAAFRQIQQELIETGARDEAYDVPYTTLHVGVINGGTVLNIVPTDCSMRFEIRYLPADREEEILSRIKSAAEKIVLKYKPTFPEAEITIEVANAYPGLDTAPDCEFASLVRSITGENAHGKVTYGTEGGLFTKHLGLETVVMGPGSMDQGHKPDEYITIDQMQKCDAFLDKLVNAISF